jgi:hypothetical protein
MVDLASFREAYVIPVVMGLAAYLKAYWGLSPRLLPLVVMGLATGGNMVLAAVFKQPIDIAVVFGGLIAGLTSLGLYSGAKNTVQKRNGNTTSPSGTGEIGGSVVDKTERGAS